MDDAGSIQELDVQRMAAPITLRTIDLALKEIEVN